jgi:hypothetical protein
MAKHVREILGSVPREYLTTYVASPLAQHIYKELFRLHVDLVTNRKWDGVERRLNVAGGEGCLLAVAHRLISQFAEDERDQRVRNTMSNVVEDFLMNAVGNDPDVLLSGTAMEVIEAVDRRAFESTAGYFLTFVILRMLEREHERLSEQGRTELRSIAETLANRVWARFERDYLGKPFGDLAQTTPGDLLHILSCTDWFAEELRK